MPLICANCQTENPSPPSSAPSAHRRWHDACPNCGTANPPGAKFCSECATPLAAVTAPGAGASPRPAPAHEAERRLVSILFADLVGFTPFAEERDAEDVRESLSQYFELATTGHRALRRDRGEVHRRRRHGGVGRADDARGRRGARRPGRLGPRRRRPRPGPGHRGSRRRPHRRGGRHASAPPTRAWSPATS